MESDQTTLNSLGSDDGILNTNPQKNHCLSPTDNFNEDDNSGVLVDEDISAKSNLNETSSQNGDAYIPSECESQEGDPDSETDHSNNDNESVNNDEEEDYDDGYTNYGLRKSKRNAATSQPNQPFQESEDSQDIKPTRRKKQNSDEDYHSEDGEGGDSFIADSSLDEDNDDQEVDYSSEASHSGKTRRKTTVKKRRLSSSNTDASFNSSDRDYFRRNRCGQKTKKTKSTTKSKTGRYGPEQLDGWLRAAKRPKAALGDNNDSGSGSDWDTGTRNRNKPKSGGAFNSGTNSRRAATRKLSSGSSGGGHNERRLSKSSSEETDNEGKKRTGAGGGGCKRGNSASLAVSSRRTQAKKTVCYREALSSDEKSEQGTGEGGDMEEGNEMEAKDSEPTPLVKTIERVLLERMGCPKAVGEATTSYNAEMYGDPNEDPLAQQVGKKERQYLIKWIGESHLHNTWESMDSLKQLGVNGIKKVENFIKNEAETKKWKQHANPEDVEYYYCQKEMADDLLKQYQILERIIAHKTVEIIQESMECGEEREEVNASSTGIKTELRESIQSLVDENGLVKMGDFTSVVKSEFTSQTTTRVVEEQYYLCKWHGLPYAEATWERESLVQRKFAQAIDAYHLRRESEKIPYKTCKVLRIRPRFSLLKEQPDYMGDGNRLKLRDYQLDGVNWLARSWCKNNSVILADEMGLGKTIQVISFLSYLFNQHDLYGPFLIIAPLSTIAAWQRETTLWAPQFNAVVYLGDVKSREMIQDYEWHHEGTKRLKFNVILTTYEILLKDKDFLGSYSWALLAVDEAHRLKNEESQFYKVLIEFRTNFRLLVTGTPLQNSLKELWALLHFIMPNRFDSWPEFEASHLGADQSGYTNLHKELEPFILRRVKKDVEKSLPSKVEQILRVGMTSLQRQYYKWILTRNYKALCRGGKGSTSSFLNIVMELKKCCNHCYLTKPEEKRPSNIDPLQHLIRGSGKLILLDKLLRRLKETGHRVLIFSQMVRMLDIIAEYLQYRCFTFQRLDGSVKNEIRKQSLDHFNAENSQDFCFLLSTRAGGLGVNLATADTVIIFDSDWNPQNDLQAQARAHRIGQKNQVNIYRFVTKDSIEEDIIQRAKKKMILDHLVIQRMNTTGKLVLAQGATPASNRTPFNKAELSSILKFGAEDLFKEDRDEEEPQVDIDDILKRAETAEEAPTSLAEELLSQFKVTDFAGIEEAEEMEYSSMPTKKSSKKGKKSKGANSDATTTTGKATSNAAPLKKDYTFNEDSSSTSQGESSDDDNNTTAKIKLGADSGSEGSDGVESDPSSGENEKRLPATQQPKHQGKEKDWDEIIPKTLREKVEAEERQKEIMKLTLGPRVRKTIVYDESHDKKSQKKVEASRESSRKLGNRGSGLYKGSKRKRGRDEGDSASEAEISPGSGSELSESAELGGSDKRYGGKKGSGPGKKGSKSSTQVPFNDSEIRRFVKSFRKFPNPQNRLEEVVYDADLQDKPTGDIKVLCKFLLNSYRDALALEQKRIEALKTALAAGNLPAGPVPNASFKINEVVIPLPPFRKSMEDLECLYHSLPPEQDLRAKYKLKVAVKTANWGVPWSLEEDNKLLVGVYNHGMGNWEAIKMNTALGLQNKIMPNNNGKPQAKNLVTRLDYLLKTLKAAGIPPTLEPKIDKKKSKQRSINAFLTSKTEDGTTKEGKKDESKGQAGENETQLTAAFEMAEEVFVMCKEKMRPVKKALKQLDNPDPTLSEHDQLNQTKHCLLTIGDHIQECLSAYKDPEKIKEWRSHLWAFVSKFTEYEPKKLHKLYKHAYRKRLDEAETKKGVGGPSYPHARDSLTNRPSSSHATPTNSHNVDSIASASNPHTAEPETGRTSKKLAKHYPPADTNANKGSYPTRRSSSPTVNDGSSKQNHHTTEKQPNKYKETESYSNQEYYHNSMYRRSAYHRDDGLQSPQPYEHSRSNRSHPRRGYQNLYQKSTSPPPAQVPFTNRDPHSSRTEIISPASPLPSPIEKEIDLPTPATTKIREHNPEQCDSIETGLSSLGVGQSEDDPNNTSLNCVAEEGEIVGDTSNGSNDTSIHNDNTGSNNDPSTDSKPTSYSVSGSGHLRNRRARRRRYDPNLDLTGPAPCLAASSGGVNYYPNISAGLPPSTRPPLGAAPPHYYNHRAGSYYYGPSPPTYYYHHHNRHRYFEEDNAPLTHPPPLMYEEDYYLPPPGPPLLGPRPLLTPPTSSLGATHSQWSPLDRYRDNDPYYERPSSYPMTYKRR